MLNRSDLVFFSRWLRQPLAIGAVLPSGRELAQILARQVDASGVGPVVELGGGTGAVTRALLDAGVAASRLYVVERDPQLGHHLRRELPGIHLLVGDAAELPALLAGSGVDRVDSVVSGLPLLAMPLTLRVRILEAAFACLVTDGAFVQFTYGLRPPVPQSELQRLGLSVCNVGRSWRNLPPATVWRFVRSRQSINGVP